MTDYGASEIFTSVARLGVILSLGSMVLTGFMHGDLMAMAGAGLQYWFMQPVFWNILQVRARPGPRCAATQPGVWLLRSCVPALPPARLRPARQVNAFCNTDDITWGTKNLDTKKDTTEAKTLMKSGLAYSANQVRAARGRGIPKGWRGGGARSEPSS